MRWAARILFLLCAPSSACAHGEAAHPPAAWTFDPWIVLPLLAVALLYGIGTARLWQHVGIGRGIRVWRVTLYSAGWLALAGALCSPLHALGEKLFTLHMIEHEIVIAVAAPLVAFARPLGAYLWACPTGMRRAIAGFVRARPFRRAWNGLTRPGVATLVHGVAIWVWHIPAWFDAAVSIVWMHRVQHLTFLLTALLFWWALARTAEYGIASWHLFVTMIHTSVLGALMALAPRVLYATQTADSTGWGLTPLQDQQLAGIVMWIPAGTIYAGAALTFIALWIGGSGAATIRVGPALSRVS
jgi:putative membrane protein